MYRFLSVKEINNGVKPAMVWNGYPVIMNNEKPLLDIFSLGSLFGEDSSQYVVTDKTRINGASLIMYEDTIHKLKEMGITRFYLLPSSIHEVIVFPCERNADNDRDFTSMVREINSQEVKDCDKLSDTILYYDGENWEDVKVNEGE